MAANACASTDRASSKNHLQATLASTTRFIAGPCPGAGARCCPGNGAGVMARMRLASAISSRRFERASRERMVRSSRSSERPARLARRFSAATTPDRDCARRPVSARTIRVTPAAPGRTDAPENDGFYPSRRGFCTEAGLHPGSRLGVGSVVTPPRAMLTSAGGQGTADDSLDVQEAQRAGVTAVREKVVHERFVLGHGLFLHQRDSACGMIASLHLPPSRRHRRRRGHNLPLSSIPIPSPVPCQPASTSTGGRSVARRCSPVARSNSRTARPSSKLSGRHLNPSC